MKSLNRNYGLMVVIAIVILAVAAVAMGIVPHDAKAGVGLASGAALAFAGIGNTQNYPLGVQIIPLPVFISGQRTATVAGVASFKIPAKMKLIGVSATARASGGTIPTLTVDVKAGGASVLSAPFAVTAGAVSEGVIATSGIADETVVSIDLAITGTTPTWDDISVLPTFVPV